jgi:hypothetical protein
MEIQIERLPLQLWGIALSADVQQILMPDEIRRMW